MDSWILKSSVNILLRSSMDSGLEAFSHNPTSGRIASLAFQPKALPETWHNGSSRTELHYYCNNEYKLIISRVKLTCLTTV